MGALLNVPFAYSVSFAVVSALGAGPVLVLRFCEGPWTQASS